VWGSGFRVYRSGYGRVALLRDGMDSRTRLLVFGIHLPEICPDMLVCYLKCAFHDYVAGWSGMGRLR
jgi:hypothetical protein